MLSRNKGTALHSLLNLFSGAGGVVGLERSGSDYWLYYPTAGGRYIGTLLKSATTLGYTTNLVYYIYSKMPLLSVNQDDGSVVRTGTWVNGDYATAYGGNYSYSLTAGDTCVITTPAATRAVGIRALFGTNTGLAKVTIDGDDTRANRLPTAQQVVDSGAYADTILVANGGTLNPTDRVLDTTAVTGYTGWDVRIIFADDLTPGVHIATITITGYKRAAATAARVYICGLTYNTTSTTVATANIVIDPLLLLTTSGSVCEAVFYVLPTGASTRTYVGVGHGYETQTDLTFTVDGSPSTPADGEIVSGSEIVATRTSDLYHPEIGAGATPIGSNVSIFTLHPVNGLRYDVATTWAMGGDVTNAYPAMLTTAVFMDRGANINTPGVSVTLADDDGSKKANAPSKAAYVWDTDGNYAALFYAPDLTKNVLDYVKALSFQMTIEDITGGFYNKIYQARVVGSTETFVNTDMWEATAYWKIVHLENTNCFPV
jgi:hypothetical protein